MNIILLYGTDSEISLNYVTFCAFSGQLTKAEELEQGAVGMSTFVGYMKAAGGVCVVTVVFFLVLLAVSTQAFSNYWLSYWINQGSGVSKLLLCS